MIPKLRKLSDGSYLAKIYPSPKQRRADREGILVRLVDYRIDGFRENYRLMTDILDPAQAPALELACLYSERWTIETAIDELKTHLRGSKVVLRSKLLELVRQDVFGLLLAHYGVRFVMHDAALSEDIAADELSFVHTSESFIESCLGSFLFPPRKRRTCTTCFEQKPWKSAFAGGPAATIHAV